MGMECMFHRNTMQEGRSSSVLRQLSLSRVPDSSWSCSPSDEDEEKKLARQVWEWQWEWEWQRQCEVKERKKVMVVVDASPQARTAMMWALSHLVNRMDTLILVHVLDTACLRKCKPDVARRYLRACHLLNSMRSLCISRIPQVQVEGVMIQGDKTTTIVSYANKLRVSLLVLGQRKPSLFHRIIERRRRAKMVSYRSKQIKRKGEKYGKKALQYQGELTVLCDGNIDAGRDFTWFKTTSICLEPRVFAKQAARADRLLY